MAGPMVAARMPPAAGPAMVEMLSAAEIELRARTIRLRPTRAGRAAKLAESNHTNVVPIPAATAIIWAVVSPPARLAAGTLAASAALASSHPHISFWRFIRSASAPAKSPKVR